MLNITQFHLLIYAVRACMKFFKHFFYMALYHQDEKLSESCLYVFLVCFFYNSWTITTNWNWLEIMLFFISISAVIFEKSRKIFLRNFFLKATTQSVPFVITCLTYIRLWRVYFSVRMRNFNWGGSGAISRKLLVVNKENFF